ncbi:hypothetical protein Zmor_026052 [Zophobas morio]|uniref:Uncharacterized protein n=1 Tax=Zophobas morio TaxID=2755281 RepID=A0AA38HSW2_9CUCU|nr:hypothetical protein Zmor_026052 [Zophobas morio]
MITDQRQLWIFEGLSLIVAFSPHFPIDVFVWPKKSAFNVPNSHRKTVKLKYQSAVGWTVTKTATALSHIPAKMASTCLIWAT